LFGCFYNVLYQFDAYKEFSIFLVMNDDEGKVYKESCGQG